MRSVDRELGVAAAVDPDAAPVRSPVPALDAARIAELALDVDLAAPRGDVAMRVAVVLGRAGDRSPRARARTSAAADDEARPAAVPHPDAAAVAGAAPGVELAAARLAELALESDAADREGTAIGVAALQR